MLPRSFKISAVVGDLDETDPKLVGLGSVRQNNLSIGSGTRKTKAKAAFACTT